MSIRARILLSLWPVLSLLPLGIALFELRVQARELRWAQREEVTTLARALAEMARTDPATIESFEGGETVDVPARVRTVIEREQLLRVAGLRLADRTRAFDSHPSRPMAEPGVVHLDDLVADDVVHAVESGVSWTAWAPVRGRTQEPLGVVMAEIRSDAAARRAAAWRRTLLVGGIPSLASFAVCLWLAGFVTRHVRRLRVVSGVGEDEGSSLAMHLERLQTPSLPAPSPIQEVQDLGTALDTMTSVLAESVEKTRRTLVADAFPDDADLLPGVFNETLAEVRCVRTGRFWAEARRVGVGAGHAMLLDAHAGQVRAAVLRLAGHADLEAQVAAQSAVELLRRSLREPFAAALERLTTLYRVEAAAAAEADAAVEGYTLFRYDGPRGWSTRRVSGTEVLHTLGGESARSVELYLAAYGSTPSGTLADELAALAGGRHEGVLVVFAGGHSASDRRPPSDDEGKEHVS